VTSEDAQVDLMLDLIAARYGRSFSDEERARVRADLVATFERTASLRALRLTNADEPMPLFTVEAYGDWR
jgi:plasmid stability protein